MITTALRRSIRYFEEYRERISLTTTKKLLPVSSFYDGIC